MSVSLRPESAASTRREGSTGEEKRAGQEAFKLLVYPFCSDMSCRLILIAASFFFAALRNE